MPENQISKIRLNGHLYNIATEKNWAEADSDAVGYIANKTHYAYDGAKSVILELSKGKEALKSDWTRLTASELSNPTMGDMLKIEGYYLVESDTGILVDRPVLYTYTIPELTDNGEVISDFKGFGWFNIEDKTLAPLPACTLSLRIQKPAGNTVNVYYKLAVEAPATNKNYLMTAGDDSVSFADISVTKATVQKLDQGFIPIDKSAMEYGVNGLRVKGVERYDDTLGFMPLPTDPTKCAVYAAKSDISGHVIIPKYSPDVMLVTMIVPSATPSEAPWYSCRAGLGGFDGCLGITSVSLPDSLTVLGKKSFYKCTSLKAVSLPNSLQEIGPVCFEGCTSLEMINIPPYVTDIGGFAFYDCNKLHTINFLGSAITAIGTRAFGNCYALKNIDFPYGIKTISLGYAFKEKTGFVFTGCTDLKSVCFPATLETVTLEGNAEKLFNGCGSVKLYFGHATVPSWAADWPKEKKVGQLFTWAEINDRLAKLAE